MAHGLINVLDAADLLKDNSDIIFSLWVLCRTGNLDGRVAKAGQTNIVFAPTQPKDRMPDFWSLCDLALAHLRDSPAFADVLPSKIFGVFWRPCRFAGISGVPPEERPANLYSPMMPVWIPAGDPILLSDTISSLFGDKSKCEILAKASLDAASKHSRENQARKMLEVFQWCLHR